MNRDDHPAPSSPAEPHQDLPAELDGGKALAHGEDSQPDGTPSVIERIGEITGSKPQVLLRDATAGDTPVLRPLGPDECVDAGKYVVHGELGRGGVGTVHRGHDRDLGRDVAMKFLHERHKDKPTILHRFVEEAQIGGQLQHPGIVPVYDLGMADGKPFFAMKLVKGQTLARNLADRESPASDRRRFLAIFESVCQTLAYAHARGVVHRDLKPDNIMIGHFGEVQVVDWGMGKVLASGGVTDEKLAAERRADRSVIETVRSGGHGSQSMVGSVMGTPAYMPPEQARGDINAMDERSDVFALGAVLCEILTGQPPYVGEPDALLAMAAMAELDDARARLESCGADPEMVELAMRCLMPAPAARPRSAEVVASSVHDHLAAVESRVHEARVEAAEAKVRAAALKRTQVLGIGLTMVIAAGLVASLWFWREAQEAAESEGQAKLSALASAHEARVNEQLAVQQTEIAVQQTEIAERELDRAVEIKRLITEMLQSVDPDRAKRMDVTLLEGILDTASRRLTEGVIQDQLVAAELHALTGSVYKSIGRGAKSEQHLSAALELRERLLGNEHPLTLESMGARANSYQRQGSYSEAEGLFTKTLAGQRRVLGEEHPSALATMCNLATLYVDMDRLADAESLQSQAMKVQERVLGPEHPSTVSSISGLALIYGEQERFSKAEELFLRARSLEEEMFGPEHPSTLTVLSNLAVLYHEQGRYADAEALMVQCLTVEMDVLGEEHPGTLGSRSNLANLYVDQGRYTDAEPQLRKIQEINTRVLGKGHPESLGNVHNLARLYIMQGRPSEAETLLDEVLALKAEALGEEHSSTLASKAALATVYTQQGRYLEAEALLLETLEIQESELGESTQDAMATRSSLVMLYMAQRRLDEAEALLIRDRDILIASVGGEHVNTLGMITNLGVLYNAMGRFEDAASQLESSLPIMREVLGSQHPWTGNAMQGLVTAYTALERNEKALPLQREMLENRVAGAAELGASARTLNTAAWTLLTHEVESLRDPERALDFAERACALAEEAGAQPPWAHLDTLALAQHRTGDSRAAVETQKRAAAGKPDGADSEMEERLAEYEAAAKERR